MKSCCLTCSKAQSFRVDAAGKRHPLNRYDAEMLIIYCAQNSKLVMPYHLSRTCKNFQAAAPDLIQKRNRFYEQASFFEKTRQEVFGDEIMAGTNHEGGAHEKA